MKKFLKITAVILLSLLIFFVGTFKYRQYQANQISIPKNTTALIKFSADEIYKSLATNLLAHPGFYLKSDSNQNKASKIEGFEHGLKIPASIYFYSIQNQPKTALFSRLAIDNLKDFENFLKGTLKFQLFKKEGLNYGKSRLGNITILYNNDAATLVVSNEVANYDSVLTDILKQKNQIKIVESNFKNIAQATGHIAFQNLKNQGSINFENGAVKFSFEFLLETIVPSKTSKHRKFNVESSVNFWLNADFAKAVNKPLKLKTIVLESDSLAKYYEGYMDFEWTGTTNQLDSVISYDYNDDFEKVEKVTLQKRKIPNFIFSIDAVAGFKNYLSRQNVIHLDSGIINKSVFPLYKVFANEAGKQLIFSTKQSAIINPSVVSSDDFFGLNINFSKLNRQLDLPVLKPYLKNLKQLEVNGEAINRGKVRIKGNLSFIDDDINSLYQILKGL